MSPALGIGKTLSHQQLQFIELLVDVFLHFIDLLVDVFLHFIDLLVDVFSQRMAALQLLHCCDLCAVSDL